MFPTIGDIVIYRSRTGDYETPAIVNCTTASIYQPGVDAGHVPPLSSNKHVHLTVFTPGKPGMRREAGFETPHPVSENVAGCYQEWDIPFDPHHKTPGSWRWSDAAKNAVTSVS